MDKATLQIKIVDLLKRTTPISSATEIKAIVGYNDAIGDVLETIDREFEEDEDIMVDARTAETERAKREVDEKWDYLKREAGIIGRATQKEETTAVEDAAYEYMNAMRDTARGIEAALKDMSEEDIQLLSQVFGGGEAEEE